MYEIGMLILYDRRGVYKIERIGAPPVQGTTGDYYELCALFSNSGETIYLPADMVSSMRPLISAGEAIGYLELFSRLEPAVFHTCKAPELSAHYREMISDHRVESYLLLLKEIYIKQRELAQQKKRPGQADIQYLKLAEKVICEEFSVVLNTTPELIQAQLRAAMRHRVSV